jgi:hypothetical protein
MDVKEIVCEGMDYIQLAQYSVQWLALVNMVKNLGGEGFIKVSDCQVFKKDSHL